MKEKNSRRVIKSLENKIGQNNLAKAMNVSPSTIRRWKKNNKIIGEDNLNRIAVFKERLKYRRPTKKRSIKNKRFDFVKKYRKEKYYKFTKTKNITAEVFNENEINGVLAEFKKIKLNGHPIEYFWITINGIGPDGEESLKSTDAMELGEEEDYFWKGELDFLKQDYSISIIVSYFVRGKSFQS